MILHRGQVVPQHSDTWLKIVVHNECTLHNLLSLLRMEINGKVTLVLCSREKSLEQRSMQSLQPHISRGAIAVSKITRAASKKGAVKVNLRGECGVRQQGGRE